MNYRKESHTFINQAFNLLDKRKNSSTDSTICAMLHKPFYLQISKNGKLSIREEGVKYNRGNTYNSGNTSMITKIGKLLATYLELLQTEVNE